MKTLLSFGIIAFSFLACTKDSGKNPSLAFSDKALFDSCANPLHRYYKNDAHSILSGNSGPHGTFKLRFNTIAFNALTENGKLPSNALMPDGSLVVKEVLKGSVTDHYTYMYKHSGAWLWGELNVDRGVRFSVNKNPGICVDCHSQPNNRDLLVSFKYY